MMCEDEMSRVEVDVYRNRVRFVISHFGLHFADADFDNTPSLSRTTSTTTAATTMASTPPLTQQEEHSPEEKEATPLTDPEAYLALFKFSRRLRRCPRTGLSVSYADIGDPDGVPVLFVPPSGCSRWFAAPQG